MISRSFLHFHGYFLNLRNFFEFFRLFFNLFFKFCCPRHCLGDESTCYASDASDRIFGTGGQNYIWFSGKASSFYLGYFCKKKKNSIWPSLKRKQNEKSEPCHLTKACIRGSRSRSHPNPPPKREKIRHHTALL